MSRAKGAIEEDRYAASLKEIGDAFGMTEQWAFLEVKKALVKIAESGELDAFKDLLSREKFRRCG